MNKKIQKSYIDYGFGFPVQILNAPLKKIHGEWALDLNFEKYEKTVLFALALKPARLTGNEVKFIRYYFEMDLKSFGKRFGDVAHSAVIKWEKFNDEPTNMNWATEKDIRLAIVDKLKPKVLRKVYEELQETVPRKSHRIKIDPSDLKAA
ncbi:MAG: hypothetical protein CL678_15090 [Bdellovibrionaceae bacterium]|nr:hypothetical protein [Pseudobdellovibrionaceae bacterium]|tara:strand:+ start:6345 stop:6794 length:450 start_codon:yes stop_codon:yes gene_type:complete